MKEILLSSALVLLGLVAKSQSMLFEIKPYVVNRTVITEDTTFLSRSDTSVSIGLTVCGVGVDSACVNYTLYREDGSVFEQGNVNAPLQAVAIAIARPLNIDSVNIILRRWNIEAIRQIENE